MTGMEQIAAERRRQIEEEGYTPTHDARQWVRTIIAAADAYARADGPDAQRPESWPHGWAWKPRDLTRNLVRAGALYLAAAEAFEARRPLMAQSSETVGARARASAAACAQAIDALSIGVSK